MSDVTEVDLPSKVFSTAIGEEIHLSFNAELRAGLSASVRRERAAGGLAWR